MVVKNHTYSTVLEAQIFDGLSMYSSLEAGETQLYFYNDTALNYGMLSVSDYEKAKAGEGFSGSMNTMLKTNLIPGRAGLIDGKQIIESACQKITKPTSSDNIISGAVRTDMLMKEAFPGLAETGEFKGVLFNGSAPRRLNLPMLIDSFQIASAIASCKSDSIKKFISDKLGKVETYAKAAVGSVTALEMLLDPSADAVGFLSVGKYSADIQNLRDNLDFIQNGFMNLVPVGAVDENLFKFNPDAFEKALVDPNTGKTNVHYFDLLASLGSPTADNKLKIKLWLSTGTKKEKKVMALFLALDAGNRIFRIINNWNNNQQASASETIELLEFIATELIKDYAEYAEQNLACSELSSEFDKVASKFSLLNLLNVSAGKTWSEASRPSEVYFTVRRNATTGKLTVDHSLSNIKSRGYSLLQAPADQQHLDERFILQPDITAMNRPWALVPEAPQKPIVVLARQGLKVAPQVVVTFPKVQNDISAYFDAAAGDATAIYSSLETELLGRSSTTGQYMWADVQPSKEAAISFTKAASTTNFINPPISSESFYAALEEKALGLAPGTYNITTFSNINSQNILKVSDLQLNTIGGYKVTITLRINKVEGIGANGIPMVNKAMLQQGEFRFYVLPNYEVNKLQALLNSSDIVFDGGCRAVFVSNYAGDSFTGLRRTLTSGSTGWQVRVAVKGADGEYQRIESKGFTGQLNGKDGYFLPIPDNFFKTPIVSIALYDPLINAYSDLEGTRIDDALKSAIVPILRNPANAEMDQVSSAIDIPWFLLKKSGDTASPTVTAAPAGGTYSDTQSIILTASEPSTIYYTIDGSQPTPSSILYGSPISLNSTTTLKSIAVDSVGNSGAVKIERYTINNPVTSPYLEIKLTMTDRATAAWNETDRSFAVQKDEGITLTPRNGLNVDAVKNGGYLLAFVFKNNDPIAIKMTVTYSSATNSFRLKAPETGRYSISEIGAKNSSADLTYIGSLDLYKYPQTLLGADRYIPSPIISPLGIISLPRTGQSYCYNTAGATISCSGSGQDADKQMGAPWDASTRFTDNNNGTVTDNLTGLVWLQNANCTDTVGGITKGSGSQTWMDWENALTWSSNLASGKCGLSDSSIAGDWRMPNINELESLIDLQKNYPALPMGHPFSNIDISSLYWSSTFYVSGAGAVWTIKMSTGGPEQQYKSYTGSILPVRDGATGRIKLPATGQTSCWDWLNSSIPCAGTHQDGDTLKGAVYPGARFKDNGDQTMTDNLTGLVWDKNGNSAASRMTWQGALNYLQTLNSGNYLGHNDWRLPNRKELMSLLNRQQANNADWLNDQAQGFSNVQYYYPYWSSSTDAGFNTAAWYINFDGGYMNTDGKSMSYYVWPVRGGTSESSIISVPQVTFSSENYPDNSYQVGSTTKSWRFKNGAAALAGLKAVKVSADAGLGITVDNFLVNNNGSVAANSEFLVNLPINPSHNGAATKTSYWKLVDGNGNNVIVTNSRSSASTNQFWLKLKTNRPPVFLPLQRDSMAGQAGASLSLPILASDPDGDPLTCSISIDNGAWQVLPTNIFQHTFTASGTYQVAIKVDDGHGETALHNVKALVTSDYSIRKNFFSDVHYDAASGNVPKEQYLAIQYLALKGITIGYPDPGDANNIARIFKPAQTATQAEALAMVMKAAAIMNFITLDAKPRDLPNLVGTSWVAPYVLKAEELGMIDSAESFDPSRDAGRAWLASVVNAMLKLDSPFDIINPVDYSFADSTTFNPSGDDYDAARAMAYFGYMGSLGQNFNPNSPALRGDVAMVASRVLLTPTLDGIVTGGLTQQMLFGMIFPSATYGQNFTVNGLANLASHRIKELPLTTEVPANSGIVVDESADPGSHIKVSVIRVGTGMAAENILANSLATAPITVPTNPPDIRFSELRNLLVLVEDTNSHVRTVRRLDYGVLFPDRDGDGVRDDQDKWPDNPLYATDTNSNGIPDNADAYWGLTNRKGSEIVTVGGQQMTLINALLQGKIYFLVVPNDPVVFATNAVSQSGFTANWYAVPGASEYRIDLATDSDFTDFVTGYNNKNIGNVTSVVVTGLAANSTYYYRLRACNAVGASINSNSISLLTLSPPISNLLLNSDFESGHVNWTETSSTGKANYLIFNSPANGAGSSNWYAFLAGDNALTEQLSQNMALPADAASIKLDFDYLIVTDETTTTQVWDDMKVLLYDQASGSLIAELDSYSNLNHVAAWTKSKTYDLLPYKGRNIKLVFVANTDTSSPTEFKLDNIRVTLSSLLELSISFTGSGGGSVNSNPSGIACIKGSSAGCSAAFPAGGPVELMPLADAVSIFDGWSACSGTGNCTVSMASSESVAATFTAAPKAKIGSKGFASLALAYADVINGGTATILLLGTDLGEEVLTVNNAKKITLIGGYNAAFSSKEAIPTLLKGALTIAGGSLTVDGLVIK